jgi:hypothetical protein
MSSRRKTHFNWCVHPALPDAASSPCHAGETSRNAATCDTSNALTRRRRTSMTGGSTGSAGSGNTGSAGSGTTGTVTAAPFVALNYIIFAGVA